MTHHTNPESIQPTSAQPEPSLVEDYPINGPSDLPGAWEAALLSNNPDEERDRIVRLAFNNGWEASLPKEAREWIDSRDGTAFSSDPKLNNVATGTVLGAVVDDLTIDPDEDDDRTIPAANLAAMRGASQGTGTGSPF